MDGQGQRRNLKIALFSYTPSLLEKGFVIPVCTRVEQQRLRFADALIHGIECIIVDIPNPREVLTLNNFLVVRQNRAW